MTREQRKRRKRAMRRDVILLTVALVIGLAAGFVVEAVMPAVAL